MIRKQDDVIIPSVWKEWGRGCTEWNASIWGNLEWRLCDVYSCNCYHVLK